MGKKKTESIVKDIKRQTRRKFNAEEKIRIVLEGLKGEDSVAEICRREGIAQKVRSRNSYWNRIPQEVRKLVADTALDHPAESARNIACMITDKKEYFVSESSMYRILREYKIAPEPVFSLSEASDEFKDKTTRVHQMWQTDFTYFKIIHRGWYYLSTILDDYSRFIVHWELCSK